MRSQKHTTNGFPLFLAWPIAILLICTGCTTPLNHIGVFSRATADLSKNAAAA